MPGASLASQSIEGRQLPQTGTPSRIPSSLITHQIHNEIISTQSPVVSSAGAFSREKALVSSPARGITTTTRALNRAQILRRQAWQEAERWAQAIARRRGWKLQTRHAKGTPDRTGEVLRLLNLS